ncbi:ethionine resistance protein [Coemansia sp. RSA 988]|nr:ethionine resistance protein [Coemansia sp. RSA 988]
MPSPNSIQPGRDDVEWQETLDGDGETDALLLTPAENEKASYKYVAGQEARWLVTSSIPIIVTYFLQFSLGFANFIAIGRLGGKEMAATSMAFMASNILVLTPTLGYASAMDTYCATTYTASPDKKRVGMYLQRAIIVIMLHILIISPIYLNIKPLMLSIGQDEEIAELCGRYMRLSLAGCIPWALYECTKRFLQAQGIMHASTVVIMVVAPIHWLNSYLLILSPKFGLGYNGAPINLTITFCLMFFGIWAYVVCNRKARLCWGGLTREAFSDLGPFFKLSIPAAVAISAQVWSYEILTLMASYFGPDPLAAQAILINIMSLTCQIPAALGYTATPRIGNLLGASRPRQARISSHVILYLGVFVCVITSASFVVWRQMLGEIYNSNPAVVSAMVEIMPIAGLFLTCNGLDDIFTAVLRGIGRQRFSANIVVPSYIFIGLPLSGYFAYGPLQLGVAGLWWGFCVGAAIATIIQFVVVVWYVDWDEEVILCMERLGLRTSVVGGSSTPNSGNSDGSATRHDGYGAVIHAAE